MSAQPSPSTTDEVMRVLKNNDDAFMTAAEIADHVGKTRQAVQYQLDKLLDQGRVERKKAGSRAVGWWESDHNQSN